MYNFGIPCALYKYIKTCRSDNNINIVKIEIVYCAFLIEIKTIYKMHGTYLKIKK
jgi:hypothetical protein